VMVATVMVVAVMVVTNKQIGWALDR